MSNRKVLYKIRCAWSFRRMRWKLSTDTTGPVYVTGVVLSWVMSFLIADRLLAVWFSSPYNGQLHQVVLISLLVHISSSIFWGVFGRSTARKLSETGTLVFKPPDAFMNASDTMLSIFVRLGREYIEPSYGFLHIKVRGLRLMIRWTSTLS